MLDTPFYKENSTNENKNRLLGIIVTLTFHAILMLLLYFYVVTTPNPPFEDNEGGMAINFGTSDVGEGDVQPMNYTPVNTQPSEADASASNTNTEESVVTQNEEDAVAMPDKKPVEKKNPKPTTNNDALFKPKPNNTSTTTNTKPTVDDNSLFSPGAFGKPNNSKGDGEGKGKGDQGSLDGDPNATSYKGGGSGNGIGSGSGLGSGNVKLAGRNVVNRYVPKNPCEQARGKVMISIKVDRDGKVINSSFSQGGSSTADECLVNVAKQAAMRYTFDAKSDAAEFQTGTILFTFKEN